MIDLQGTVMACSRGCQVVDQHAGTPLDIVKSVAAVLALPASVLTFWLGYRQREHERNRSYYQDAVVDPLLPDILMVFDEQAMKLTAAGREGLRGTASVKKTLPKACNVALADFADGLFKLQDRIVQRAAIFDEPLAEAVRETFPQIQDDLTGWFDDINLHKPREINEIDRMLRKHERAVVRMLYRGKTRSF